MREGNVFIFEHPLIQHKISIIRDKNTNTKDFLLPIDKLVSRGSKTLVVAEATTWPSR